MKVLFDLQCLQTTSRHRGIGRLTLNLLREIQSLRPDWTYDLIFASDYPPPNPEHLGVLKGRIVVIDGSKGLPSGSERDHQLRALAKDCDVLLVPSPFDEFGITTPELSREKFPCKVVGILHDLIPHIFSDYYLNDRTTAERYYERLEEFSNYDLCLANSLFTRFDLLRYVPTFSPHNAVVVGAGVDEAWYNEADEKFAVEIQNLPGGFIFYLGANDWRKNESVLLEGYAKLPIEWREKHHLVITHAATQETDLKYESLAKRLGIQNTFHHTGFVSDSTLKYLYKNCGLMAFPSLYEGFGLPILEAMACGAPVIVAHNSSLPEVAGPGAKYVRDYTKATAWARALQEALSDQVWLQSAVAYGSERSRLFQWRKCARVAVRSIENLLSQDRTVNQGSNRRRKVAWVSSFTDNSSRSRMLGDRVIPLLRDATELYVIGEPCNESLPHNAIPFDSGVLDILVDCDLIFYQIEDDTKFSFLIPLLFQFPGIVTLHDLDLRNLMRSVASDYPEIATIVSDEIQAEIEYGKDLGAFLLQIPEERQFDMLFTHRSRTEPYKPRLLCSSAVIMSSIQVMGHLSDHSETQLLKCASKQMDRPFVDFSANSLDQISAEYLGICRR